MIIRGRERVGTYVSTWLTPLPTEFVTWNPLDKNAGVTLSNENLTAQTSATGWKGVRATLSKSSGKWYFELAPVASPGGNYHHVGFAASSSSLSSYPGGDANGWGYHAVDGKKWHNGSSANYGASCGVGDVIGVAIDLDNGKIWWAKNNTWMASGDPAAGTNQAYSSVAGTLFPMYSMSGAGGTKGTGRFSLATCTYSPPSGFSYIQAF